MHTLFIWLTNMKCHWTSQVLDCYKTIFLGGMQKFAWRVLQTFYFLKMGSAYIFGCQEGSPERKRSVNTAFEGHKIYFKGHQHLPTCFYWTPISKFRGSLLYSGTPRNRGGRGAGGGGLWGWHLQGMGSPTSGLIYFHFQSFV